MLKYINNQHLTAATHKEYQRKQVGETKTKIKEMGEKTPPRGDEKK